MLTGVKELHPHAVSNITVLREVGHRIRRSTRDGMFIDQIHSIKSVIYNPAEHY